MKYAKNRLIIAITRLFPQKIDELLQEFDDFLTLKVKEKDISPALKFCLDHIAWTNI